MDRLLSSCVPYAPLRVQTCTVFAKPYTPRGACSRSIKVNFASFVDLGLPYLVPALVHAPREARWIRPPKYGSKRTMRTLGRDMPADLRVRGRLHVES